MNKDPKKPGVIVLGGHVQALGILRILGKEGIPGVVIDTTSHNIARHSRFCSSFYKVPDDQLLLFLKKPEIKTSCHGWILFPTNDFHVSLLSRHKEELNQNYIAGVGNWDVIEKFYNKKNAYKLAASLDIPIPRTFYPGKPEELESLPVLFPCIIKPAVMHRFYSQVGKKVLVCNTRAELQSNYQRALKIIPGEEIMVQEIIHGPSKNQFSACFLFLDGKTVVHLTACRMRQRPLDFGSATTYAEVVQLPVLKEFGERILKSANFNGLCEIEFKYDEKDGSYKFLEVNTRTWKWHGIANLTETPFLMKFYEHLCGKEVQPTEDFKHGSYCHRITDIPVRLQLLLNGFDYWNRLDQPSEPAVFSRDDIKPWIFEKLYLPSLIARRL